MFSSSRMAEIFSSIKSGIVTPIQGAQAGEMWQYALLGVAMRRRYAEIVDCNIGRARRARFGSTESLQYPGGSRPW